MKIKLLLFILLSTLFCGQKKKNIVAKKKLQKISCYLPSGEKCPFSMIGINMDETNKYFEPQKRTYFEFPSGGPYKYLI